MSDPLTVRLPHRLGKEEALRRLKNGIVAAQAQIPVLTIKDAVWTGDRLTFLATALGQTAAGTIDVAEDHVQLRVELSWLLSRFAKVITATVQGRGRLLLEKK